MQIKPMHDPHVYERPKCNGCNCIVGGSGDCVTVFGCSGLLQTWCWKCAGYDYENRRFNNSQERTKKNVD